MTFKQSTTFPAKTLSQFFGKTEKETFIFIA